MEESLALILPIHIGQNVEIELLWHSGILFCFIPVVWTAFWAVVIILYFSYFTYCMIKTFDVNDEGAMRLLIVTILVTVFIVGRLLISCLLGEKDFSPRIFDDKEEDIRMIRLKNG